MAVWCHRCGAELPGEQVRGFCAVCGAPQMTVGELELQAMEEAEEGGAAPPPRPSPIRWPEAMQSGGLVAMVAGLLFGLGALLPGFTALGVLLTMAASAVVLLLYRRRVPEARMSGAIGARIGLVAGLLLVAALGVALAGAGMWARFRSHGMGEFDAQWTAQMQGLLQRTQQTAAESGPGGAQAADEVQRMVARPEFRAWTTLGGYGLMGLVLVGLTAGGGALAGSMGSGARRAGERGR